MPRDVFISHSAQDKKAAETICAALEHNGIACWVAPRDVRPGKSFPGEITRAIQQCKVMLLIFSPHSNSSEQVLREVQLAVDSHLPIVRLRLADIPLSDDLRYYLSTPHWLDALTPPLTKHLPPLVSAIRELLGPSAEGREATASMAVTAPRIAEAGLMTKMPAADKTATGSRLPFAIVWAAVVVAALGFAVWSRSAKKTFTTATPAPTEVTSSPPIAASPAITIPASPTPFAVAVTPSPSLPESTATATATAIASPTSPPRNEKAPGARNNRPWQVWIDEFVHNFIASNEVNDPDLAVSFYAPNVDLFEEGRKPIDAIRRDIESYNARWPSRRATIRGDVRLGEKNPNRNYTASFEHDYYVENASRGEWINGAVAVDLQITVEGNGTPRIVSMKQKTLRKDKGTMQKR
jgi:hypothetical protein